MNTTSEDRVVELYFRDGTMAAKIEVDAHTAITVPSRLPDNSLIFYNKMSYRLIRKNGAEAGRGSLDELTNPDDGNLHWSERHVYLDGRWFFRIEEGALMLVTKPASYTEGEWVLPSPKSVDQPGTE